MLPPLLSKVFAYLDALEALVYPVVRVAQPLVVRHCLVYAQLWVLHLVYALGCHLSHPPLKRFGLGRGYRLDDTKKLLGISNIGKTHLAVKGLHFQTVTICHGFISFRF